jgi:SOS-response transcriptional repressor LexA
MTPNTELTTAQKQALVAYRRHCDEHDGEPPTVRWLADALGKSPNAAHQLIQRLREKGYLSMKPVTIIRSKLTAKGRAAR